MQLEEVFVEDATWKTNCSVQPSLVSYLEANTGIVITVTAGVQGKVGHGA